MATKKVLIFALFIALLCPAYSFAAEQKPMSLEEVGQLIYSSPNRTVNARVHTVLRGTKIESLKVVIRGIVRQPGLEIIVFTSDFQIAAGMSGSPVYVDGRLVGALAYGLNKFSDEHWGGISPISLMMEDAEAGYQKSDSAKSFTYEGKTFVPISMGYDSMPELESFSGQKFIKTVSSGEAGSVGAETGVSALKPGMPIVVDLVEWTDEKGKTTTIGSMGTITYVDDRGRIFAFGHPFLDSKSVVYGFRSAEIIDTVSSEENSYKLVGRSSGVLGAITHDSSYGIYGTIGSDSLKRLRHFSLEFKNRGVYSHKFNIKVADSIMTPILVGAAFALIGKSYGAPLPQEVSVTQIESSISLEGRQPILWKGLYTSGSLKFGPQTIYSSSFNSACEAFFGSIYGYLSENNYGLKISDVSVSVNFIPGASQTYKLGAYKFPNKVVYGQDPVLDIMFVDENNSMPIAKRAVVNIDWSKVEKPVYTKETLETEKTSEKVVNGVLNIEGAASFLSGLSGNEKQKFVPDYFLNADDFLESISGRLKITNQRIFARLRLRSRSGLFDEAVANSEDIMPKGISADDSGWHVIGGGLQERKVTLKDDGSIAFNIDLPDVPSGYVFDQRMKETFYFEVVLDK